MWCAVLLTRRTWWLAPLLVVLLASCLSRVSCNGVHATTTQPSHATEVQPSDGSHVSSSDIDSANVENADSSDASAAQQSESGHASDTENSGAGSSHASSSSSDCVEHGGSHDWWTDRYEYGHLESYLLATICCIILIFDETRHRLQHAAAHSAQTHHSKDKHSFDTYRQPLLQTLVHYASSELTVLGFVAFLLWLVTKAGLLQKIAEALRDYEGIALPKDELSYIHAIEDVHMHLFLAICLYMATVGMSIFGVRRLELKWHPLNAQVIKEHNFVGEVHAHVWARHAQQFTNSRYRLFYTLQRWRGHWLFMDDNLIPLLKGWTTITEGDADKEPTISDYLQEWFPYDWFLLLQCHRLFEQLLEIRWGSWLGAIIYFVVAANVLAQTKEASTHFALTGLLMALMLGLFIGALARMRKRGNRREVALDEAIKQLEADNDVGAQTVAAIVAGKDSRDSLIGGQLMSLLQGVLLALDFYIVRTVAGEYFWETQPSLAVLATLTGLVSMPTIGFVIGQEIVPRLALHMSRGDFPLQEYHIEWIMQIVHMHHHSRQKHHMPHTGEPIGKEQQHSV